MTPRSRIVSVGYSYRVGTVDGASGGTISGNVNITGKANIGTGNSNSGADAFVAGVYDTASGNFATVGGGKLNAATSQYTTVSGGASNIAGGYFAAVGGGHFNYARGDYSVVAGGGGSTTADSNQAGYWGTVSGGMGDIASGPWSTVGGGAYNIASGTSAGVFGGNRNRARGQFSFVGGGGGSSLADSNSAIGSYSAIGGGSGNYAPGLWATVGGGYDNTASGHRASVGGGQHNSARGEYSVVSGGGGPSRSDSNSALGQYSTIGGGLANIASGEYTTVGGGGVNNAASGFATVNGGGYNIASGGYAAVPGGSQNTAAGNYSFAAGRRAKANNQGCFVWGDATDADVSANNDNRFVARASGGVYFYSNAAMTTGSYLAAGSGTWQSVSDSTKKRNIRLVDTKSVLEKVSQLPIKQWSYKSQDPSIEHIGPMAQDFWKLFHVGDDSLTISMIDPDGIALAAIQQLQKENEQLKKELGDLRRVVEQMASKQQDSNSGKAASAAFMPKTHKESLKEIAQ
ncbi:MAG: tail fiber domain-containing protein [bacterium]